MNRKISHAALLLVSLTSFSTLADDKPSIDKESAQVYSADIMVSNESTASISVSAVSDLNVDSILESKGVTIATFNIKDVNVAARMLDLNGARNDGVDKVGICSFAVGSTDANNKIEVCLEDADDKVKSGNGAVYYKQHSGDRKVVAGTNNSVSNVVPDAYTFAMEFAQYTY